MLVESPAETTVGVRGGSATPATSNPPSRCSATCVDDPQRAVFAPLAAFSPEWQAVRWANVQGVPVEAIDLPLANTLAAGATDDGLLAADAPVDPLGALADGRGRARRRAMVGRRHRTSRRRARRRSMRSPRRWTAVRSGTTPRGRNSVARRTCASRSAPPSQPGTSGSSVVCGAWHVPALDVTAPHVPTATVDAATLRGLPKVKVAVSWVPWTHERLAAARGYGAGVRSPGWYDHVFRHPGRRRRGALLRRRGARAAGGPTCGVARSPDRGDPHGRHAGHHARAPDGPASTRCSTPPTP